jgi:hypothetical protein
MYSAMADLAALKPRSAADYAKAAANCDSLAAAVAA